jgi:AraC-like DNA-binding protein
MKYPQTSTRPAHFHLPKILSMGVAIYDPIWAQRPHATRRNIELLHVLKGRLHLVLPGKRLSAGPGDTLFVPTGVLHRDEYDFRQGLEVFLVHFSWPEERGFFRRVDIRALPSLPPAIKTEIGMLVDRMRADIAGGTEGDRAVAEARLLTLLLLLLRFGDSRGAGGTKKVRGNVSDARRRLLMNRARQYLEQHYPEPVTLEQIARTLGVSPYYLSHVFSQQSDFSLFEYLTNLRLQKARLLLQAGSHRVKEASNAVGYNDSSYFARIFHRRFGVAPRDIMG